MTRLEFRDFCRTSRTAIKDLVMEGYFTLPDPVGVCQALDSLSESKIADLSVSMIALAEHDGSDLLLHLYKKHLSEQNLPTYISNNRQFYSGMADVLQEESSNDGDADAEKLVKLISGGMWKAAAGYIAVKAITDPQKLSKELAFVRKRIPGKWSAFKKRYPLAGFVGGKAERGVKWVDRQAQKNLKDWQKTRKWAQSSKGAKAIKTGARRSALAAGGLVALSIAGYQIYDKFLSKAAISCRGAGGWKEKKICILKYKIAGCESVINQLKQELPNCAKHVNPEKCKHSINSKIWNWTKRKNEYARRIEKLSEQGSDNSQSFRYIKR